MKSVFDTVVWVIGRASGLRQLVLLVPKGFLLGKHEENRGEKGLSRFTWKTAIKMEMAGKKDNAIGFVSLPVHSSVYFHCIF